VPAVAEALFARCVEGVILAEASSNILGLLLRLCCWMGLELAGVGDTPSANSLGATPGASRLIVLWLTAKLLAIAVQASPAARRASASARWCAVSAGFRPNLTPRALARSRPSLVRARISSRSNSASPPGP
jgi:hypothetical protein